MRKQTAQQGPVIITGVYGSEIAPMPERPEPPRAVPVYLDSTEVQKLFDWTSEQFDFAINSRLQFPAGRRRGNTLEWTKDALTTWRDRIRADVKELGF
jgi:hypothetical protein